MTKPWREGVQGVIFDCDGTVADCELLYSLANVAFMKCVLGLDVDIDSFAEQFCGIDGNSTWPSIEKSFGRNLGEEYRRYLAIIRAQLFSTRYLLPVPHVIAAINGLKEMGITKFGIASNSKKAILENTLRLVGLHEAFDPHIYSYEDVSGFPKPAPDLLLFAAENMGIDIKECVVVGDSTNDVLASQAADAYGVIGFCGGSHCTKGYAENHLSKANRVISDMSQLPSAIAEMMEQRSLHPAGASRKTSTYYTAAVCCLRGGMASQRPLP